MTKRPRIEAFRVQAPAFELAPSPANRQWMDDFGDRHPYRCLPLAIANTHGWDVLCPSAVEISWNGGPLKSDLLVQALEPPPEGVVLDDFLRSHFTRGVFTFHTSFLFRTPPGWSLLVSGPYNHPKNGATPLTGIVESDWLPYPFTMNWLMTTPGRVRFEKGEPICTIMPIPKNYLGDWDVAIHDMRDDPAMATEHEAFRVERAGFQKRLGEKDPEAIKQAWQRHYFVGRHPDGTIVEDHINKVRLATPIDASGTPPVHSKPAPDAQMIMKMMINMKDGTPASITTGGPFRTATPAAQRAASSPGANMLDRIDPSQSEANIAGRQRLHQGILFWSAETVELTDTTDRASLDFIFQPGFLSSDQCRALTDFARHMSFDQRDRDISDPFWKSRVLFFADVLKQNADIAEIMKTAHRRVADQISAFYDVKAPIYADTVQLVRWLEGMHMEPHADRANPDGSPHLFAYRDFASVIYLNDDYEGGEIYFTALDMVLKPRAGTLLAFTGGWRHEHAVLKIAGGVRYSMPAFFTFDERKKERAIYAAEGDATTDDAQ